MSKKTEHNVVRILYVILLSTISLYLISPFLAPIVFGGTIALAMFPLLMKLEARGFSRNKASVILTTSFAILVSIPFFFFVVKGTMAVTEQLEKYQSDERFKNGGVKSIITTLKHDVILNVQNFGEKIGIKPFLTEDRIDTYLVKINAYLLNFFQQVASNLPTIFLFFLVMVICTYAFLRNAKGVRNTFQKVFGFTNHKMDQVVKIFIMDSRSVYVSNIATGAMQSMIVATAASLLGLGDFFLIFFITLILSFIPVIGAAPVAFVYALVAYFQDESTKAIIMVGVGIFSGVADNFLRPYLASMGESKLPAIPAFVFVVGGALLIGFPGLFIGLLVGSIAFDTLPLFWEELGRSSTQAPLTYVPEPISGPHKEDSKDILRRH